MKELHPLPSQGVLRDELTLAFRYLTLKGVEDSKLIRKYNISPKTITKSQSGEKLAYKRNYYFCSVIKALDALYKKTKDPEVLTVIAEVARMYAGLPSDDKIWMIIAK